MNFKINAIVDWKSLLELAEAGNNNAQYEVGCYYDNGLSVKNIEIVKLNKVEAFEWFWKSYELGNLDSMVRVADFLSEGIYCNLDIDKAIELYKIGISNGSSISAHNLATIYRDQQEFEKAFELYQKVEELENSTSLDVALCYYYGIGIKADKGIAFSKFLEISNVVSDKNFLYEIDEANYYLGKIYLEGDIAEQSLEKARYYFELANRDDDHQSAKQLLYLIGKRPAKFDVMN